MSPAVMAKAGHGPLAQTRPQPKIAGALQPVRQPTAQPVHGFQPASKSLQQKTVNSGTGLKRAATKFSGPLKPTVYRPQPTPKVLQAKMTTGQTLKPQAARQTATLQRQSAVGQKTVPAHHASQQVLQARLRSSGSPSPFMSRRPQSVIQRQICFVDTPTPDAGQIVGLNALLKKVPGDSIGDLKSADLANMNVDSGEVLYLLAHGNRDKVGNSGPGALADILLKRGLKNGTKIMVVSCKSGVVKPSRGTTYVTELVREIATQSNRAITAHVAGLTGSGVIMEDGTIVASDDSKMSASKMREYKDIRKPFENWNQTVEEFIKITLRQDFNLKKAAEIVAAATQVEFSQLYEYMKTVTKTPEDSIVTG
jgi:hypothetical protein